MLLILVTISVVLFFGVYAKRIKIIYAGLGFLLFVLFSVGQGWLVYPVISQIQSFESLSDPQWKNNNAIVVLGAGTVKSSTTGVISTNIFGYSRIFEAARLYHLCRHDQKQCQILVSGGDPLGNGVSEAEVMKQALSGIGVESTDIILEDKSNNTFQNAKFSSQLLHSRSFDQIVLVTSSFHLRRAMMLFNYFKVPSLVAAPADRLEPTFSFLPLSLNFTYADSVFHEYIGILQFHIYNALGWNNKKAI